MKIRRSVKVKAAELPEDFRQHYFERKERAKAKKAGLSLIEQIKNSDDPVQKAFDLTVPRSGPAETAAGEFVRAINRILYRDMNDRDRFYDGYGIETCGAAVAFLCDKIPALKKDFEDIAMRCLVDDQYTAGLYKVSDKVMEYLYSNPQLFTEKNTEDYLEYDGDSFIEENGWIPEYEVELDIPYNVLYHMEAGHIGKRELLQEVESWDCMYSSDNASASVQAYSVYIEGISGDVYSEVVDYGPDWLEDYGEQLDEEFGSEEENEDNEDEE